jgi:hypothetical protein
MVRREIRANEMFERTSASGWEAQKLEDILVGRLTGEHTGARE